MSTVAAIRVAILIHLARTPDLQTLLTDIRRVGPATAPCHHPASLRPEHPLVVSIQDRRVHSAAVRLDLATMVAVRGVRSTVSVQDTVQLTGAVVEDSPPDGCDTMSKRVEI